MARRAPIPLRPPLDGNDLTQLRLELRKHAPSAGLGAHLRRRMGQSLEFRDYRDYVFGDDIRAVDWAASARRGGKWDFVAKSFEAEERRTLMVLLDCRPAMRLPEAVPKLAVATWIAGCLIEAALAERDQVVFAPLFAGDLSIPVLKIKGPEGLTAMRDFVAKMLEMQATEADWAGVPAAGTTGLDRHLRPAAAVVLISDGLFDDPNGAAAGFARRAQRKFRTFHMIEIDSWPCESARLTAQPFRLQPVAGSAFGDHLSEASPAYLAAVNAAIAQRKTDQRQRLSGPSMIWPAEPLRYPGLADWDVRAAQTWFRQALREAPAFKSLMSRVA